MPTSCRQKPCLLNCTDQDMSSVKGRSIGILFGLDSEVYKDITERCRWHSERSVVPPIIYRKILSVGASTMTLGHAESAPLRPHQWMIFCVSSRLGGRPSTRSHHSYLFVPRESQTLLIPLPALCCQSPGCPYLVMVSCIAFGTTR